MKMAFWTSRRPVLAALAFLTIATARAGSFNPGIIDSVNEETGRFKYSVFLRQGYDSNTGTESNPASSESAYTSVGGSMSGMFGTPRTSLTFNLTGDNVFYWDANDSSEFNWGLTLTASHRLSRRVNISLSTFQTYAVEPQFQQYLGTNRRAGQYYYGNTVLQVGVDWGKRFSTVTGLSLAGTFYQDSAPSAFEDRWEYYFTNEFRYRLLPTTSLVAEYRYGGVSYQTNTQSSNSNFILGGVDYSLGRRSQLSVRAGAELRNYDNGGDDTSPFVESTFRYQLAESTTISWLLRYGYEDSQVVGDTTNVTFRTGLSLSHALTKKVSATLSAFYANSDHSGYNGGPVIDYNTGQDISGYYNPNYTEETVDLTVGFSYALLKHLSLDCGYTYTTVFGYPPDEYERNRVFLGLTANF